MARHRVIPAQAGIHFMSKKEKAVKILNNFINWLILAIIFFVPIYFAWAQENYSVFELNKIVLFRVFLTAAWALYLIKFSLTREIKFNLDKKFCFLTFLLFCFLALSTIFSINPKMSLWGNYYRQQGLYAQISYLMFAVLIILQVGGKKLSVNSYSLIGGQGSHPLTINQSLLTRVIIATIFSAFFVCLYGLMQLYNIDPLPWSEGASRLFSAIGQPNFFGHYLIMVLPLTVYARFFIFNKKISKYFVDLVVVMEIFCLLFTYSRSAWLGLFFAILFLLVVLPKNKYRLILPAAWLFAPALIIFLFSYQPTAGLIQPLDKFGVIGRINSSFNLDQATPKVRLQYWTASLSVISHSSWQRLLFGYGPEVLTDIFVKSYTPEWAMHEAINSFPDRAHNILFDDFLQYGLLGSLAILALFGLVIWRAVKYLLSKQNEIEKKYLIVTILAILVGYFVNNLLSFSLTTQFVYLYLCLAILYALTTPAPEKTWSIKNWQPLSLYVIAGIGGLFAIFVIVNFNIRPLLADHYYLAVKKADIGTGCREIFDNLEKMVANAPQSIFYQNVYLINYANCYASVSSADSREAWLVNFSSLRAQIKDKDFDYNTYLTLMRAYGIMGKAIDGKYYDEAEKNYQQLIAINPYVTFAYEDFGKMQLWRKKYSQSIDVYQKAISAIQTINDKSWKTNANSGAIKGKISLFLQSVAAVYQEQNQLDQALSYYQEALAMNPADINLNKKIADIYYLKHDLRQALAYNRTGYLASSQDPAWSLGLAIIYQDLGDQKKAKVYANFVLRLDPDNQDAKKIIKAIK